MSIGYYSYEDENSTDAFIPLARQLLAHNLWVLATPLYWYTMSAQAKTFIDRLSDLTTTHRALGRELSGKSLSVICSGTDPALPPSFDEPFRLTCEYLSMRYIGSHYGRVEGRVHVSSAAAARKFAIESIGCEG
jgi:FMN-dependent NADH-azoreductase